MVGLLIILLGAVASAASAAGSSDADLAWARGDYRAAFARAFEPASRGNAHAQFLLGEAYRLGRSVDADVPTAEQWYMRAARQGDIAAAAELGLLYAGQHRTRDAASWLGLAAQGGEPRALCSLAALYFNGDGVDRNAVLAYALMARAAADGLNEAKARLLILRSAMPSADQAQGETLALGGWEGWLRPAAVVREAVAEPPQPRSLAYRIADTPAAQWGYPRAVAPAVRPKALVSPRPSANIRIQVGAFGTPRAAQVAWALLLRRIGGTQAGHIVLRAGTVYRLQARLGDADASRDFRRRLEGAGWAYLIRGNPMRPT